MEEKIDVFTEKLFCMALLRCGTDIAAKVLEEYLEIKNDEKIHAFLLNDY